MARGVRRLAGAIVLLGLFCASIAARAQQQEELDPVSAAFAEALPVMQRGPADVRLRDQALLKLPEGYGFIPQAQATRILDAMGNGNDDDLVGLIVGDGSWFVVVDYIAAGYIKDEEARDWDVDGMLENLRSGTEEQNKVRLERGMSEMEIVGWVERPRYDGAAHRLVWSLSTQDKGAPEDESRGVNYNTYVLGREGYVSMNLVTGLDTIEAEKPIAAQLLQAVAFDQSKRYEDFDASTDHVAEYGIAALVGGVAAKKLGLLAVMAAFLVKGWKLVLIGVIGGGAALRKILGRKAG